MFANVSFRVGIGAIIALVAGFMARSLEQAAEKARDRAHETTLQHMDMAHEVGMAAAGGRSMTMTREDGEERGEEMGRETSDSNGGMSGEANE